MGGGRIEDPLQRHGERVRGIVGVPGLGPGRADLAGRLACHRSGADGVGEPSGQQVLDHPGLGGSLGHGQPDRPGPDPLGAQRHGGGHLAASSDAAGGQNRDVGTDGVDHLGDQHHGRDLPTVASGLVALGDDHVDPPLQVLLGVAGRAAECADQDALGVGGLDGVVGWRAERIDQHGDRVAQSLLHLGRTLGFHPEAGRLHQALSAFGQGRDVVLGQHLLDELPVLGRDQGLEGVEVERLTLAHELLGHGEVDPVGLAATVLVDPGELDLELVRAEGQGAEHAVAARPADLGHDVSAMGEGKERELDAEAVTDLGAHGC